MICVCVCARARAGLECEEYNIMLMYYLCGYNSKKILLLLLLIYTGIFHYAFFLKFYIFVVSVHSFLVYFFNLVSIY